VDYYIYIDEQQSHDNLVLEVEALMTDVTPRALSVYLFDALIPVERNSEQRSEISADNVYSIAINSHDLHPGQFILSVHCVAQPVVFRVIGRLVHAQLHVGESTSGAVCPGEWVYHTFTYDSTTDDPNAVLQFDFTVHSGDFYYLVRPDVPPIKLSPPYQLAESGYSHSSEHLEHSRALVCHVTRGTEYYLALRGAGHCSEYDVSVSLVPTADQAAAQEECRETDKQYIHRSATTVRNLVRDGFVYATVEPHEIHDFMIEVTEEEAAANNIVFEVEGINDIYNPSALKLSLYERVENIPESREASKYAKFAHGTTYDISLNYLELKAGRYFLSVQSMGEPVRYRAAVRLIASSLVEQKAQFGQVCPGRWTFHYVDVPEAHNSVDFKTHIFSGEVYMAFARSHLTPGFNSINEFELVVGNRTEFHAKSCDAAGKRVYFALFGGGDVCADYNLFVDYIDDGCATVGEEGYDTEEVDLNANRSTSQKTATRVILFLKNATIYVLSCAMLVFFALRLWLGRKQFGASITGLFMVRSTTTPNETKKVSPRKSDQLAGEFENPMLDRDEFSSDSDSEAPKPKPKKKSEQTATFQNPMHPDGDSMQPPNPMLATDPDDPSANLPGLADTGPAENRRKAAFKNRAMSRRFMADDDDDDDPSDLEEAQVDSDATVDGLAYSENRRDSLYDLFQEIDIDGSDSLDVDEITVLARRLGKVLDHQSALDALHEMNPDGDTVNFDQFAAWWKSVNEGKTTSSFYTKGQGLSTVIKAPMLITQSIAVYKRAK
jgi:hypothetical protein